MSDHDKLDIEARRREKQAARDRDARALADGSKSAQQIQKENAVFAIPGMRLFLSKSKLS